MYFMRFIAQGTIESSLHFYLGNCNFRILWKVIKITSYAETGLKTVRIMNIIKPSLIASSTHSMTSLMKSVCLLLFKNTQTNFNSFIKTSTAFTSFSFVMDFIYIPSLLRFQWFPVKYKFVIIFFFIYYDYKNNHSISRWCEMQIRAIRTTI